MKKLAFLPLSLRARILWLVLISVIAAQALTLYVIFWYQRNQVQSAAVSMLVTSIRTVQSAMQFVPVEQRAAFVQTTSQGEWRLRLNHLPRDARFQSFKGLELEPDGAHHMRKSLRRLSKDINRALGEKSQVAIMASGKPLLYVSLGDKQWLEIPLDRVDPPITNKLLMGWLISLGVLLVAVIGFSWRISAPIARLVKATNQLALGEPHPVKPAGPKEVRQLGEGFNAMLQALQQSQQTQRTLLAGLPHDLKGPLARMALRIEMTDDEVLKQGLKRDLADMQRMVEQFLDFIRGQDADRLNLKPVRLDQWLMRQVADDQELSKPVEIKTHELLTLTDAASHAPTDNSTDLLNQTAIGTPRLFPVTVLADTLALDRIWSNLMNNALEHGEPPIEVFLYLEKSEIKNHPDWVVLTFSDHGKGIASKDFDRAFEPFERLDNARTRTGSVGLGLSLVKGIVMAHSGTVSLAQNPHGGLQVKIMLPTLGTVEN
jgi:two-component system osmolarity sensor histidine kinase EnvZ